jgi:hypothetical protein
MYRIQKLQIGNCLFMFNLIMSSLVSFVSKSLSVGNEAGHLIVLCARTRAVGNCDCAGVLSKSFRKPNIQQVAYILVQ